MKNLATLPVEKLLQKPRKLQFPGFPSQIDRFPDLRYMGSKRRLLPWIHQILDGLDFESALDPFSGSGAVSYLMKAMGRRVVASDFLNLSSTIGHALIENNKITLDGPAIRILFENVPTAHRFIEKTFRDVFYTRADLRFLDRVSGNLRQLDNPHQQALAMAALMRSCVKRQPRGVFTVSGDLSKYDDGRRDLRLSIEEHFLEQIEFFNEAVFSNGRRNYARREDVFKCSTENIDLVYLDPPYVPRSDDNCYIKRYHFLEGLSCYWQGLEIDFETKVRKIPKLYTPFSYRSTAIEAFDNIFRRFRNQKIVLSYSSNGYPDLDHLTDLLNNYKSDVRIFTRPHRYHFGTHEAVKRSTVTEYLLVGL
ncbi:MAG: (2Fe-2S)-binding protein [Nitrospirales bacterium]|nr:MAG: (2Fe-2S)-binding protein [Nitrospirales bacterium]